MQENVHIYSTFQYHKFKKINKIIDEWSQETEDIRKTK